MNSGRPVYVEGADIGFSNGIYDIWPYLGAEYVADGNAVGNVRTLAGAPGGIVPGWNGTYPYAEPPDAYVDILGAGTGTLLLQDQDLLGRAVSYTGTYHRAIVSAVILGAVGEPTDFSLLEAITEHLLLGTGLAGPQPVAPRTRFAVSPNPVRRGGSVRLELPFAAGTVTLHDAAGRRVGEFAVAGPGAAVPLGDLPAGAYFARAGALAAVPFRVVE